MENGLFNLMKMELKKQGIEWEECDLENFHKLLTNMMLLKTAQDFGGLKVEEHQFLSLLETTSQKNIAKLLFKHIFNIPTGDIFNKYNLDTLNNNQ
jgi:hypothetical protein